MRNPTTVLCIDPLDRKFFMWGFMIPSCKRNDTLKDFGSPWLHTASQNVQSKFASCATKRNANVQTYQSRNMFFANSSMAFIHNSPSNRKLLELLHLYFLHWKYWSCSHNLRGLVVELLSIICRGRVDSLRSKNKKMKSENDDTVKCQKKHMRGNQVYC